MGCFLSLHFGIRESERRIRRREQQASEISSGTSDSVAGADDIIFCPQSESFETTSYNIEPDNQKFGVPLRRFDFRWRLSEPIPKTELETRKVAFWETCYTNGGQSQVWNALKLICSGESRDLDFAQRILESCGIILPYGQLTEIYDSKGFRYNLPPYCVCCPINIDENVNELACKDNNNELSDKIKIRLSDGKDILIDFSKTLKISEIKSFIRNQESIDLKRRMVVLWCGKVLDDSTKLGSLNLPKGAVLQVMVP